LDGRLEEGFVDVEALAGATSTETNTNTNTNANTNEEGLEQSYQTLLHKTVSTLFKKLAKGGVGGVKEGEAEKELEGIYEKLRGVCPGVGEERVHWWVWYEDGDVDDTNDGDVGKDTAYNTTTYPTTSYPTPSTLHSQFLSQTSFSSPSPFPPPISLPSSTPPRHPREDEEHFQSPGQKVSSTLGELSAEIQSLQATFNTVLSHAARSFGRISPSKVEEMVKIAIEVFRKRRQVGWLEEGRRAQEFRYPVFHPR